MGLCRDDSWKPTFVHEGAFPYYVTKGGAFVKLRGNTAAEWTAHACELIRTQGVRDPRGFEHGDCRRYTDIQCTCQRGASEGCTTCRNFFAFLDAGGGPS
jgi:hypothetical protein